MTSHDVYSCTRRDEIIVNAAKCFWHVCGVRLYRVILHSLLLCVSYMSRPFAIKNCMNGSQSLSSAFPSQRSSWMVPDLVSRNFRNVTKWFTLSIECKSDTVYWVDCSDSYRERRTSSQDLHSSDSGLRIVTNPSESPRARMYRYRKVCSYYLQ